MSQDFFLFLLDEEMSKRSSLRMRMMHRASLFIPRSSLLLVDRRISIALIDRLNRESLVIGFGDDVS